MLTQFCVFLNDPPSLLRFLDHANDLGHVADSIQTDTDSFNGNGTFLRCIDPSFPYIYRTMQERILRESRFLFRDLNACTTPQNLPWLLPCVRALKGHSSGLRIRWRMTITEKRLKETLKVGGGIGVRSEGEGGLWITGGAVFSGQAGNMILRHRGQQQDVWRQCRRGRLPDGFSVPVVTAKAPPQC